MIEVFNIIELDESILGFKSKYKYYACDNGRIFSEHLNDYMKEYVTNAGYLRIDINDKHFSVHRLIALAFIPNPGNKPEVNHKDTDKSNNKPSNLEWVTRKENNNYPETYNKRCENIKKGEENNFHKLTEMEVKEIIRLLNEDEFSNQDIATMYNVIPKSIRNIKNNKTWKHIPRN